MNQLARSPQEQEPISVRKFGRQYRFSLVYATLVAIALSWPDFTPSREFLFFLYLPGTILIGRGITTIFRIYKKEGRAGLEAPKNRNRLMGVTLSLLMSLTAVLVLLNRLSLR